MNTLSERLIWARERKKWTQGELAQRCGVSQGAIGHLEAGTRFTFRKITLLARVLEVDPIWLAEGKGTPNQPHSVREEYATYNSAQFTIVQAEFEQLHRVPLISYVQAGSLSEAVDPYVIGDASEYLITHLDIGPNTFALEIKGASMLPEFREGDRIIVDPDIKPSPGQYVVAKNGHNEATFKKYRPRGVNAYGQEVFELVALNEDYPSIRSDITPVIIIGTVVEHRKFLGRK